MTDTDSEREILSGLLNLFTDARSLYDFSSLRIWREDGEVRFFLTNNPPPNKSKQNIVAKSTTAQMSECSPLSPPRHTSNEGPPTTSLTTKTRTSPATTRTQAKKKRRRESGTWSPEIFRNNDDQDFTLNVTHLEEEREDNFNTDVDEDDVIIPNVPVSNIFDALTCKENTEKIKLCYDCSYDKLENHGKHFEKSCDHCGSFQSVDHYQCKDCNFVSCIRCVIYE